MTNWEKHRDKILMIYAAGYYFGVFGGKVTNCNSANCKNCLFGNHPQSCADARLKWLQKKAEGGADE